MKRFKKVTFLWALLHCVLLQQTTSHTSLDNDGVAHFLYAGTCVGNEQRPENQVACKGHPFGELVPYPGDCAKFLVCNCEYPTVKDCAAGTWFDNKLKICNFPQNVECDNSGGAITTTTTATESTTVPTTTSMKPCNTSPQTTTSVITTASDDDWEKDCIAPEGMTSDICSKYDNGVLLRYPYDCNAYINCTQGCPVMTYCVSGKVFNDVLQICDTPETAHCENLPMPSTTTELDTTTDYNPNTPMVCDPPLGINADYCSQQVPGTLFPYPYDCSAYILCNWLCPFLEHCEPNKVFNVETGRCESANTVVCVEIPYPTLEPTTVTTTVVTPTPMVCDPPLGINADYCSQQVPGTLFPYPYDCSAYILCNWLCPFLEHCEADKVFNPNTGSCDCAHNVECVEIPYPTTETSEPTTGTSTEDPTTTTAVTCEPPNGISADICVDQSPGTHLPYPYNCTAYILCNWSCPHLRYCAPDKVYNSDLGICDSAEDVICIEIPYPTPIPPETTTGITEGTTTVSPILPPGVNPELCEDEIDYKTFPYEGHCHEYLLCIKGKVEIHTCPKGWIYNAELGMCDEGGEDICYNSTTTAATETTTVEHSTTTSAPIYDVCKGQPKGTSFSYAENCQMYYYCRGDGTYYLLNCPFNNYYDPYSGNCGPDVSHTACKAPPTTTTSASTTFSPVQMCAEQCAGTTLPYEANCRQYIMCMGSGRYQILNCPENNFYYPDSGDCGPSTDEDICHKGTTTAPTSTSSPGTTITTEAPSYGICGSYTHGEFMEYPNNCQKYISCVRPIPIAFYCPNAWYFEINQQKCIPDTNGVCNEHPSVTTIAPPSTACDNKENGEWALYPGNCQMFYECLGNKYFMLQICPENEYFDPPKGQCSKDVDSEYCQQNFDTTTTLVPTTAPSPSQNLCYNEPIGSKIPYPGVCSKFIVCEQPIPVGQNCPQGLEFSSRNQKCVVPKDSDCGGGVTNTTRCFGKSNYTLLPYEDDCSLFVICINDLEYVAYCNHGQYFDSLFGECRFEANIDSCLEDPYNTTTVKATETTSTSTSFTSTSTESTSTIDPNLGPCYGQPEGTKLPYPNNCEKYIVCQNPIPVGHDCFDGLEFSESLGECVSREIANCSIKSTTGEPTTTATTNTSGGSATCDGLPNGSTLTYPDDCSKYYICVNGNPRLSQCMPNSYYDPTSGECDSSSPSSCRNIDETTTQIYTSTVSTEGTSDPCYMKETGYTFVTSGNCSQFYMCLNNSTFLTNCPAATFYNLQLGECNSETTSDACKESESSTQTTVETITHTRPITTVTPIPPPKDNICCGQEPDSLLSHPNDKTKYVICQYPLPVVVQCPDDTIFDSAVKLCDTTLDIGEKPQCSKLHNGTKWEYVGNCQKYFVCKGQQAIVYTCRKSEMYNPHLETCVPSELYQCRWQK